MSAVTDRAGWAPTPSGIWTPQQKLVVVRNYVNAYNKTPANLRRHGAEFYPNWHEDAAHIGEVTGLGHTAGAAIIAHLSPSNEAEQNRIHAMQLTHGIDDRAERYLLKAAVVQGRGTSALSQRTHALKREDYSAATRFDEQLQKHRTEQRTLRRRAGIVGTPLGNLASREIGNALMVRRGDYADPLASLGGVKMGDFGRMIADPSHPGVPVDTHYHDAGVNRYDLAYRADRLINNPTRYGQFQGASEEARQRVSRSVGYDIDPSAFMGGIWFGHQQRKVDVNPKAMQARRATETKLANIRASAQAQAFLPERFGLRPAFGKIDTGT